MPHGNFGKRFGYCEDLDVIHGDSLPLPVLFRHSLDISGYLSATLSPILKPDQDKHHCEAYQATHRDDKYVSQLVLLL